MGVSKIYEMAINIAEILVYIAASEREEEKAGKIL